MLRTLNVKLRNRGKIFQRASKYLLQGALLSVLLSLFSGITGCATSSPDPTIYPCEQPSLQGETWADIAILSIEQRSAIEVCNIRNGVSSSEQFNALEAPTLGSITPRSCRVHGVAVVPGAEQTGTIIAYSPVTQGSAGPLCPDSPADLVVGCTHRVGAGLYYIVFELDPWVITHEICHAVYETMGHTQSYKVSRDIDE